VKKFIVCTTILLDHYFQCIRQEALHVAFFNHFMCCSIYCYRAILYYLITKFCSHLPAARRAPYSPDTVARHICEDMRWRADIAAHHAPLSLAAIAQHHRETHVAHSTEGWPKVSPGVSEFWVSHCPYSTIEDCFHSRLLFTWWFVGHSVQTVSWNVWTFRMPTSINSM
jgi:hypothetical protein